MTQYVSNHTPTSSLSGWSKTSGTLTATSDGARWVSSGGRIQVEAGKPGHNNTVKLVYMRVRRNTAASTWPSKIWIYSEGRTGGMQVDLRDVDFPVGQWVTIPTIGVNNLAYEIGGGVWWDRVWVYIDGPESGTLDFTFRQVGVFDDNNTDATMGSADTSYTHTGSNNSLVRTFTRTSGDESVASVKWTWGDGTTTSGPAAGSGQVARGRVKTYSGPGVYSVKLESTQPPRGLHPDYAAPGISIPAAVTVSSTQSVTVPTGTFQAGFNYQSDYPQILVDASSSVAPSLSPITTYAWNWGDGTTGSGLTASHTYAAAGSYNVTLTVSNATVARSSAITKSVTLTAPQLPVTAPQFALQLFLDDPASVVTSSGLQAEMNPILDADSIRWNWTRSEIPTMDFKAPASWISDTIPGVTQDTLRSDIVLRVNWGAGWYEPPSSRFIIDDIKVDPLNPQEMVTVSCQGIAADDLAGIYFTPAISGAAYTNDEIADGYQRTYASAKPGAVLVDLLPVATTPGTGAPHLNYMNIDFSATVDSKGVAWASTMDVFKVPADTSGLGLLQSLIDAGTIDWYCQKNLLRVFNPGQGGRRTSGDTIPELLPGRDIMSAPQRQSPVLSKRWGAVVIGDKKTPYVVTDTLSTSPSYQREAYRGRRYVAIQAGDAASSAAALALAKPSLANIYRTKDGEMVRELRFYSDMPWMPLRDYWVGDTVYAPGPDGKLITVNVEAITLTQSSTAGTEGALILGNAYAVNSLAKKTASLSGGSGISIGSVRPTSGDTGWVNIAITSGYTAQAGFTPQVRRIGNVVYIRGGLTSAGFTASGVFAGVLTIPLGFRPPTAPPIFRGGTSSGLAECGIYLNTNGTIDIRTNATLSSYYMLGGHSWLID